MEDPHGSPLVIRHHQEGHLPRLHPGSRLDGKGSGPRGNGIAAHEVSSREVERILGPLLRRLESAADVAIRDDAQQPAILLDRGHPEVTGRDGVQDFDGWRPWCKLRPILVHQSLYFKQSSAKTSSRVIEGESLLAETPQLHEGGRQQVTPDEL